MINDSQLRINEEISSGYNYRFIIADNETLAELVCQRINGNLAMFKAFLAALRAGDPSVGNVIIHCLKGYEGNLLPKLQVVECHNLVPNVLRYSFASLLSGNTVTPTFKANEFALGTGSNAASNSDTALQTESTRAEFTDRSFFENVTYLDVFFPSSVVGGNNYNEAGILVDGTGSPNTGYLLSRVVINQTLGSNQTLTVNCSITIT